MLAALLTFTLAVTDARQSAGIGAREVNPIMRPLVNHPAALYGVKIAGASALTLSVRSLKRQGHPRWAWALWVGANAAQGAVVIVNARR